MADPVVDPAAPAAAAPVASATPAPGAAPAPVAAPSPAPAPAPSPDPAAAAPAAAAPASESKSPAAPAAEVPAAKAAAEPPAKAPAGEPKPDAAAAPAAEAPKDGEPKPDAVAAEPEAPKAPEFKLPENVKADPAVMTAYNNVLTKYGISAEAGQELIDFHANTLKAASEKMTQDQQDAWAKTNADWVTDFNKSAGNQRDTILNDAKFAISDTIKDVKARQALWDVLTFTGAGNNKLVVNALAKMGKRFRESTGEKQGAPVTVRSGTAAERRYGPKT